MSKLPPPSHSSHTPVAHRLCASLHHSRNTPRAPKKKLIGTPQRPTNEKLNNMTTRLDPPPNPSNQNPFSTQREKRKKREKNKTTVFKSGFFFFEKCMKKRKLKFQMKILPGTK